MADMSMERSVGEEERRRGGEEERRRQPWSMGASLQGMIYFHK